MIVVTDGGRFGGYGFLSKGEFGVGLALIEHRYDAPFKFTGKIDKPTFKLESAQETKR